MLMHAVTWTRGIDLGGPFLIRYGRPEEAMPVVEDEHGEWRREGIVEREVLLGIWPFRKTERVVVTIYRPVPREETSP